MKICLTASEEKSFENVHDGQRWTDDDGWTDAGYLHIYYKLTYDAGELIIYSSVSSEDSDQPGHQ